MSVAWKRAPQSAIPTTDALLIFAFFVVGSLAAFFASVKLPGQACPRQVYSVLLGGVYLLSVSAWGNTLIPLFSMACGVFTEQKTMLSVFVGQQTVDWGALLCSAVLVPVFFLCTAHGMAVSSALSAALERGSPTARSVFHRELALVSIFTLAGFACVFYFF